LWEAVIVEQAPRRPVLDTGLGFPWDLAFGSIEDSGSIHAKGFGKTRLIYAERHTEIQPAIAREKLVKKWRREWKSALIKAANPDWLDFWNQWYPVAETKGEIAK